MRISFLSWAVFFTIVPFQISKAEPASPEFRELTILVYAAGDEKDIEIPTTGGIKALEASKALKDSKNLSVFVLHDRTGNDKGKPSVYALDYVEPGKRSKDKVDSKPVDAADLGKALGVENFTYPEWNSGSAVTLKQFIRMGVRLRPARHYVLLLQGHSWGQDGFGQDYDDGSGKVLEESTLIPNYLIRQSLKEAYVENAAYIPLKKFDAIMMDGCTWGQLDIALEVSDEVNYIAASSLETPYWSMPYTEILDEAGPQLDKLVAARPRNFNPNRENEKFNQFLEKFFKIAIEKYVKHHGPDGSLSLREKEVASVQYFAIRTAGVPRVKAALAKLVEHTPKGWLDWREGKMPWLNRIIDIDTNIDLSLFAKEVSTRFRKNAETNPIRWAKASEAAEDLKLALGNQAPNRTLEPTHIKHDDADGAWVTVDIDPLSSRDMAVCMGLQAMSLLKFDRALVTPVMKKKGKEVGWKDFKCPDYHPDEKQRAEKKKTKKALALEKRTVERARAGRPFEFPEMWDFKLEWEHGVSAYVTEKQKAKVADGESDVSYRALSVWVPKGTKKALSTNAIFRFAGTTEIKIDYLLKGNPKAFMEKGEGEAQTVTLKGEAYLPYQLALDDKFFEIDGKPGLFVGWGTSNHSFFKSSGFGIMMTNDFSAFEPYNRGPYPLEVAEKKFGKKFTLESYEKFVNEQVAAKKEKDVIRRGVEFYRLLRINDTGWTDFVQLQDKVKD